MIIKLTPSQAELLTDILQMQLQIETEHLDNCLNSISKHNTRNIIKRMQTIKAKLKKITNDIERGMNNDNKCF